MNNRLPLRTRSNVPKEDKLKTSDILSFSSALFVVASSAIFYLAGWFYLAHWYAFFGIDITQINLPTQVIIIHGLPSILILVLAGLSAATFVAVLRIVKSAKRLEKKDFPVVVVMAYVIAFLLMGIITIAYTNYSENEIPVEVFFSSGLALVLIFLIVQLNMISSYMTGESKVSIPSTPIQFSAPRAYAMNALFTKYVREKKYIEALKLASNFLVNSVDLVGFLSFGIIKLTSLDFFGLTQLDSATEDNIQVAEKDFAELMKAQKSQLTLAFTETWQFWVGAVLILYLLISVATSAVIGEWDAVRGKRLLVGDWQIPEISLYSKSAIPALEKFEIQSNPEYEYKPLGLLASDNNVYYLVDWKTTQYYPQKPKVYIIPRSDGLILNFIISPFIYPTSTPLPTRTVIPTITPTLLVTVTSTP